MSERQFEILSIQVHVGEMTSTAGCHLHSSGVKNMQVDDCHQQNCVYGKEQH